MPMTKRQLAYEKRRIAHHEAGHAVVAIGLGLEAWAKIWETPTAWLGNCTFQRDFISGVLRVPKTSKRQRAAISVAGVVAEFWLSDTCIYTDPESVLAYVDYGYELSATDAAGLPGGYAARLRAVETAVALLEKHAAEFKLAVKILMAQGVVHPFAMANPKAYAKK